MFFVLTIFINSPTASKTQIKESCAKILALNHPDRGKLLNVNILLTIYNLLN